MEGSQVSGSTQHPVPAPRNGHPANQPHISSHASPQGPPVHTGELAEHLTVVRREVPLNRSTGPSRDYDREFSEKRACFVGEYLSDSAHLRVDWCAALIELDLPLDKKYRHLNLPKILDLNKERSKFLRLPKGLGILEKYASNLIKTQRPPYWRSVKFTSPFVRTHVSDLSGSRDILFQMGYTENIQDGVSFPEDVREPDVLKLKDMAPELFLARYEIDALIANKHPYWQLIPLLPSQGTAGAVSALRSTVQLPKATPSSFSVIQGPPVPKRLGDDSRSTYHTEKPQLQEEVLEKPREATRSPSVDQSTESEGDSEYEDAEDGVPSVLPFVPQVEGQQKQTVTCMGSAPKYACQVCGEGDAGLFCRECRDTFCTKCDGFFHKHPSRQHHFRSKLVTPQIQKKDATPVKPPLTPDTPRKRPVPAPRSKTLHRTSGHEGQAPQIYRQMPSRPTPVTAGQSPAIAEDITTTVASSSCTPQRALFNQNRTREILRPPPFARSSTTPAEIPAPSNSADIEGFSVGFKDIPPPLPPKTGTMQTVSANMDTGLPPVSHRTTSPGQKVISCPNCFCLNPGDANICVACGRPFGNKYTAEQKLPVTAKSTSGANMSTGTSINLSTYSPMSNVLQHPSQNYQPVPRQAESARMVNPGIYAPFTLRKEDDRRSFLGIQPAARNHVDPPSSSEVRKAHSLLEAGEWSCEYCTLINRDTTTVCQLCSKTNRSLPKVRSSAVELLKGVKSEEDEQHLSRSVSPSSSSGPEKPIQSSVITRLQSDREQVVIEKEKAKREYKARLLQEKRMESAGVATGGSSVQISPEPNEVCAGPLPVDPVEIGTPHWQGLPGPAPIQCFSESAHQIQQRMAPEQLPDQSIPKNLTNPNLLREEIQSKRREQDDIYMCGLQMVEWMKMAETEGFQAEELNIATVLGYEDPAGPIHWLKNAWYDLIHSVMIRAVDEAQDLGNVTPEEARAALIECTGDVSQAVSQCLSERRRKLTEISQSGVYPRTECLDVMDQHDGDVEKALNELERRAMAPMLQRVLDSCLPDDAPEEQLVVWSRLLDSQESHETGTFEATVIDKNQDVDRRIRVILVEKGLQSWGRAETSIKLIDMDFSLEDAVEAARAFGDLHRALRYLKQECPLCTQEKPMGQMITFLHCQDRFCRECVSQYFSITIKDRNIKNLVCPQCGEPNNLDDEGVATEYFNNLDIMIRQLVNDETHDLFQRKLRDRTLVKEPNFRWCQHCSSGFINEQPDRFKMTCPQCQQHSCFSCKQKWEVQHDGLSCEQFEAWKEANDPERQAAGLAAHLKKNGIECPNCKYRYDLAKGGCMHFKCTMCPHEFCSGCYSPYKRGEACGKFPSCANKGLHAHHPRDCLFYMRDSQVEVLQQLLQDNDIEYDTEPPQDQPRDIQEERSGDNVLEEQAQVAANAQAPNQNVYCKVMEQKETGDGLVDGECGDLAPADYAGLCKDHYLEYLVGLVNDNLIDPADIMSTDDLNTVLQRENEAPPERGQEDDEEYKGIMLQFVKERVPLPRLPPRRRVLADAPLYQPAAPALDPGYAQRLHEVDMMRYDDYMVEDEPLEVDPLVDYDFYDHNDVYDDYHDNVSF